MRAAFATALATAAVAIVPSIAAAEIGADGYPTTLHGEQIGTLSFSVPSTISAICSEASFKASLTERAPSVLTSSVSTPKCTTAFGVGSLDMNGCQLELDPEAEAIAIGPPECGPAILKKNYGSCEIPAQSGLSASYETVTPKEGNTYFTVDINAYGVEYVSTSPPASGGFGCGSAGPHSNMGISGEFKVFSNGGGVYADAGGLEIADVEGDKFTATQYPATVSGERLDIDVYHGNVVVLDTGKHQARCDTVVYSGGQLNGPAASLKLTVSYPEKCNFAGGTNNATVEMQSCYYVYSNLGEGAYEDEIAADAEIACDEAEDVITITAAGCKLSIPAQTYAENETGFGNFEFDGEAVVLGVSVGRGLTYWTNGAFSCGLIGIPKGPNEDGSTESGMQLRAEF